MLHNVALVSAAQKRKSAKCMFISPSSSASPPPPLKCNLKIRLALAKKKKKDFWNKSSKACINIYVKKLPLMKYKYRGKYHNIGNQKAQCFAFLVLWPCCVACNILVPDQELNLGPGSESFLTTGPAGNSFGVV